LTKNLQVLQNATCVRFAVNLSVVVVERKITFIATDDIPRVGPVRSEGVVRQFDRLSAFRALHKVQILLLCG